MFRCFFVLAYFCFLYIAKVSDLHGFQHKSTFMFFNPEDLRDTQTPNAFAAVEVDQLKDHNIVEHEDACSVTSPRAGRTQSGAKLGFRVQGLVNP